ASLSHRELRAFPTRRSSDLPGVGPEVLDEQRGAPAGVAEHDVRTIALLLQRQQGLQRRLASKHRLFRISERRVNILSRRTVRHIDRKSTRLNSSHVKISYAV